MVGMTGPLPTGGIGLLAACGFALRIPDMGVDAGGAAREDGVATACCGTKAGDCEICCVEPWGCCGVGDSCFTGE